MNKQNLPVNYKRVSSAETNSPDDCSICHNTKTVAIFDVAVDIIRIPHLEKISFAFEHPDAVFVDFETCTCVARRRLKKLIAGAEIPPRRAQYTLAHFEALSPEIKAGKEDAIECCRILASDDCIQASNGSVRYGVVLYGKPGTGKTTLGTSVVIERLRQNKAAMWLRVSNFLDSARDLIAHSSQPGYSGKTSADLIQEVKAFPGLLVLDEFGNIKTLEMDTAPTAFVIQTLLDVIDYRLDYMLPTVLTTNLDGDQIRRAYGDPMIERMIEAFYFIPVTGESLRAEAL